MAELGLGVLPPPTGSEGARVPRGFLAWLRGLRPHLPAASLRPLSAEQSWPLRRRWGRDLCSVSRAGSMHHPLTSHPLSNISPPLGDLCSLLLVRSEEQS